MKRIEFVFMALIVTVCAVSLFGSHWLFGFTGLEAPLFAFGTTMMFMLFLLLWAAGKNRVPSPRVRRRRYKQSESWESPIPVESTKKVPVVRFTREKFEPKSGEEMDEEEIDKRIRKMNKRRKK